MNRLKSPTASLTLLPLASLASLLALTVTALGVTGCAEDGAPEDGGIVVDEGPTDEDEPAAQEPAEDARITGVLVGEGGLTYDIDGGERDDWGPAAYLVDERGLNWIADGPGNKILVVDDEGSIVDTYLLDGLVRRIEDIAVTPTHVYILDTGLTQPTISRVGRSDAGGAAWESFAMPADVGDRAYITGLRADFDGTIALELGLGTSYYELFSPDGEYIGNKGAGPQVVHRVGERSVELIGYSGEPEDDESVGAVLVDGVQVATVTTAGMLGGFTFVTANADDEFWLRVQDVAVAGEEFRVRDFAYRMSLTGEILEIVQMPIEGEAVYVYNRLAFDLEGNPRALTTQPEEVVLAVPQASSPSAVGTLPAGTSESLEVLASAAPSADDVDDDDDDADAGSSRKECLTGAEIITRAHEYANYTATYSSSNLDNTCAGRKRPGHQVGVPISGVIYRYAGCQQLSTYDAAVKAGKVVGDVKASYGVAQCANGVDCSGFVSQTWQHSYHQTYNMDKISTVIDRKDVIPGDAMNKPHKHVRLIEQNLGSNNFMIVESTTGGYDRVVRRIISWGNNNGYKAIRYQGHCGYYGEAPDPMDPPPMDPPPMDPPPMDPQDPMAPLEWHIRNTLSAGWADVKLTYGYKSDIAIAGDFNGDGVDTPAVFRDGTWYIKNTFEGSLAEVQFNYGVAGDIPVVGDWNGDGTDTVGVYRGSTFMLRNSNSAGWADLEFAYGVPGDVPVVGDWNGDGKDTIGVFRDGSWMLRNSNTTGWAEVEFDYGPANFIPVVGDWNGNGQDTVGVVRPEDHLWLLNNKNESAWWQIEFQYGVLGDQPLTGDWNGDGKDANAVGI